MQVHRLSPNGRVTYTAVSTVLKTVGAERLGGRHLTLSPVLFGANLILVSSFVDRNDKIFNKLVYASLIR